MNIKAGAKLSSATCDTQIMVLRVPAGTTPLVTCGGLPMSADPNPPRIADTSADGPGTLAGKRYVDEAETTEFLCTRAGKGELALNGVPMRVKQAKQLPSSD